MNNVIEFPTKFKGVKAPKITDLDAVKMQEDLNFADNLAEGLMKLKKNGGINLNLFMQQILIRERSMDIFLPI